VAAGVQGLSGQNFYGYPAAETIRRLEAAGASVYRTDGDGTVIVSTDGITWTVSAEYRVTPTSQVRVYLPLINAGMLAQTGVSWMGEGND
jgi:competence protein ComEC